MEFKHPTKPLTIRFTEHMGAVLYIRGKLAGNVTHAKFGPVPENLQEAVRSSGTDPADCRCAQLGSQPIILSIEPLEWLHTKVEALRPLYEAAQEKLEAKRVADREARQAEDAPLLEAMDAEIERHRREIPDGRVEITVIHDGDYDGYPRLEFRHGGVSLRWDEVKVESAHAIRPGAMGAFASRYIAHADPETIAKASARAEQNKVDEAAAREAVESRNRRKVPGEAIAAYNACQGDPERFPDDIDDPRYWLVKEWAGAIEAQDLCRDATLRHLSRELRENRELLPPDA